MHKHTIENSNFLSWYLRPTADGRENNSKNMRRAYGAGPTASTIVDFHRSLYDRLEPVFKLIDDLLLKQLVANVEYE